MRILLMLWGFPLVFFWGWYGLSANDITLGTTFFSRQTHDLIFGIYGHILGMEPSAVPLVLAKIFFVDTLLVFGIAALRWYKHWLPQTLTWCKGKYAQFFVESKIYSTKAEPAFGPMRPAE